MAKNVSAVENQLSVLKAEKNALIAQQSLISAKLLKTTRTINRYENLSEEEKDKCLTIDFAYYPEIPTRIKTIFINYARNNNIPRLTALDVFKLGKKEVSKINGIGKWSIIDLENFFNSKGLEWK